MKTNILAALATTALLAFTGCKKETASPGNQANPQPATTPANNTDGVSVNNNRLKFATVKDFETFTHKSTKELASFHAHIKSLGFVSKKEQAQSPQNTARTSGECNCDIDDDFAKAVVDKNYMLDIGNWTIKLDGCKDKYYALYTKDLSEAEIDRGIEVMNACNYDSELFKIYEIDITATLVEELDIQEAIINGDPNAGERRCKDVACSDRDAVSWADVYTAGGPSIPIPECRLFYDRHWLDHGSITVYALRNTSQFTNFFNDNVMLGSQFHIEFDETDFYEKCGTAHHQPLEQDHFDNQRDWAGQNWWFHDQYIGARLKAGDGTMKARVVFTDGGWRFYATPWMEIVF